MARQRHARALRDASKSERVPAKWTGRLTEPKEFIFGGRSRGRDGIPEGGRAGVRALARPVERQVVAGVGALQGGGRHAHTPVQGEGYEEVRRAQGGGVGGGHAPLQRGGRHAHTPLQGEGGEGVRQGGVSAGGGGGVGLRGQEDCGEEESAYVVDGAELAAGEEAQRQGAHSTPATLLSRAYVLNRYINIYTGIYM